MERGLSSEDREETDHHCLLGLISRWVQLPSSAFHGVEGSANANKHRPQPGSGNFFLKVKVTT